MHDEGVHAGFFKHHDFCICIGNASLFEKNKASLIIWELYRHSANSEFQDLLLS